MKKIIVHLTKIGAAQYRNKSAGFLGSDKALAGFGSLLTMKRGIQANSPEDFQIVETNELYLSGGGTLEKRVARAIGFRAKNASRMIERVEVLDASPDKDRAGAMSMCADLGIE